MTSIHLERALLQTNPIWLEEYFEHQEKAPLSRPSIRRGWIAAVAACCCLCLLITGASVMQRMDYHPFSASCGSYVGKIMAGRYYYFIPHDGVYCYDPEANASHRVLHTFYADDYLVGAGGIFYRRGRSVFLCNVQSGERRHLYTADPAQTTHIALDRMTSGDIAVTCYNKHESTLYQVILHGMRGTVLHTTAPQPSRNIKYSEAHHAIGEHRNLELVQTATGREWQTDLQKNGVSLLPQGATVSKYSVMRIGLSLWFPVDYPGQPTHERADYLVLTATGETRWYSLPYHPYAGGDGSYLFYPAYDNGVGCVEIASGESWVLQARGNTDDVYDIVCDGTYLYTTAPWCEQQSAWRIERDETGKPISMILLNPDLAGQ